jgi:hypothetical protein
MTMTVDRFDMLWALGFLGSMVLLGADGADVWFLTFSVMLIWWFREPLVTGSVSVPPARCATRSITDDALPPGAPRGACGERIAPRRAGQVVRDLSDPDHPNLQRRSEWLTRIIIKFLDTLS